MTPFDPGDPDFLADPYPTFDALRATGPVHSHPLLGLHEPAGPKKCGGCRRRHDMCSVWRVATAYFVRGVRG